MTSTNTFNSKTYPTYKKFKHSDGDTSILSKTTVGNCCLIENMTYKRKPY